MLKLADHYTVEVFKSDERVIIRESDYRLETVNEAEFTHEQFAQYIEYLANYGK